MSPYADVVELVDSVGSDGSAACGGRSDLSEWPRSIADEGFSKPRKISGTATGRIAQNFINADVVELVDSVDLGSSVFDVQVRVLSSAPKKGSTQLGCFLFYISCCSLIISLNCKPSFSAALRHKTIRCINISKYSITAPYLVSTVSFSFTRVLSSLIFKEDFLTE